MKYGDMFAHLLKSFGVLCIGLYRFRDTATSAEPNPCAKRYVITNPPADFKLLASDKVFNLICFTRARLTPVGALSTA